MKIKRKVSGSLMLLLIIGTAVFSINTYAGFEDQHAVQHLINAMKTPLSDEAIKNAREADDQIMSQGEVMNAKVYLVSDERYTKLNTIVVKLLDAMNEDPSNWIIRFMESDPPVVNAFVTGGKYIYVYTALIDQAKSDDELAFVLSHELGHSLLKHAERREDDITTTLANIAVIAAAVSKNHSDDYGLFAEVASTTYGRIDEEEADAIAVAITKRAGFNPLRGAEFFGRQKREQDQAKAKFDKYLADKQDELNSARKSCQVNTDTVNSSKSYQTQDNYNIVTEICNDAEAKRLEYNNLQAQSNAISIQEGMSRYTASHPENQQRIAAIAALTDFIYGRRSIESLDKFEQSQKVMKALQATGSALLKPTEVLSSSTHEDDVKTSDSAERLKKLKSLHAQDLITDADFEKKRQEILNQL